MGAVEWRPVAAFTDNNVIDNKFFPREGRRVAVLKSGSVTRFWSVELFQRKVCSRRRQSAQIEQRRMIWRELTFAAARFIELL